MLRAAGSRTQCTTSISGTVPLFTVGYTKSQVFDAFLFITEGFFLEGALPERGEVECTRFWATRDWRLAGE